MAPAVLLLCGLPHPRVGPDSYIATSQNYYCAESEDEVSMYCNVLAYDPTTDVDAWTFAWTPADEVMIPQRKR